MGDKSGIEWTDATWNPTTGCDQVSPGCENCYALTLAKRLKAMGSAAYQQDGDPRTSGPGFALQMHPDRLDQPLRWTRPRRIFVNSMSDLFHPKVTDEFIARVFAVMALAEQHTFQVLTKRPKRMRALLNDATWVEDVSLEIVDLTIGMGHREPSWSINRVGDWWPLPNVWLGTSVEDQQRADERIPALLDTPAAVRFLSCEPLLGPVDLVAPVARWMGTVPDTNQADLHWVIVGGESGHDARPMHPAWVRSLRDHGVDAGVPFFFKQWGAWAPPDQCGVSNHKVSKHRFAYESDRFQPDGRRYEPAGTQPPTAPGGYAAPGMETLLRVGKKAAGRDLDGRTWDQFPQEVPA